MFELQGCATEFVKSLREYTGELKKNINRKIYENTFFYESKGL